eukprot:jgi/Chlat1/3194/Chrsp22S03487
MAAAMGSRGAVGALRAAAGGVTLPLPLFYHGGHKAKANSPGKHKLSPRRAAAAAKTEVSQAKTDEDNDAASTSAKKREVGAGASELEKDVARFARKAAGTFAPRSSTKQKNPAQPGTLLYSIFEWQSILGIAAGGLLSYNLIFPSEGPSIARLIGMWSVWMFAVPGLRARDCKAAEKDALNILFLLIPVINVTLPIFWKSFAAVYSADVIAMATIYAWKVGLPGSAEASSSSASSITGKEE